MKHSKYKNGGLLFELLTRQIAVDALNNNPSSKATEILGQNFHKNSELFKEVQFFNVLLNSKFKSEGRAKHLIETTITAYNKHINRKKLTSEKYQLIKQIKETFNISDFFKSKVHNYKLFASIHNVVKEDYSDPASASRNYFTVLEHITSDVIKKDDKMVNVLRQENKDLRSLAYKFLVEKFNKKYNKLSKQQKDVLREYINSISNTNGLKEFLQSKFKQVLHELKKSLPSIDNKVVRIKIRECINLLEGTEVKAPNTKHVLRLMRFYQLLEDVNDVKAKNS